MRGPILPKGNEFAYESGTPWGVEGLREEVMNICRRPSKSVRCYLRLRIQTR